MPTVQVSACAQETPGEAGFLGGASPCSDFQPAFAVVRVRTAAITAEPALTSIHFRSSDSQAKDVSSSAGMGELPASRQCWCLGAYAGKRPTFGGQAQGDSHEAVVSSHAGVRQGARDNHSSDG